MWVSGRSTSHLILRTRLSLVGRAWKERFQSTILSQGFSYSRNPLFVCILSLLLAGLLSQKVKAEQGVSWRTFTSVDGLAESWVELVTVGSSGDIWISHGVDVVTRFDGYRFEPSPSPGFQLRPYEGVSEQIWSKDPRGSLITLSGFQRLENGTWVEYPIVSSETGDVPFELAHTNAYFPLQKNRVVFLLSDSLLEFNSETRQVSSIKEVAETRLERFTDMTPSRDGGVWIAGYTGVAKLNPNGDRDGRYTWREFPVPDELECRDFHRILAADPGELFALSRSTETNREQLLILKDDSWSVPSIPPITDMAAGWGGHDASLWIGTGFDYRTEGDLFHIQGGQIYPIAKNKVLTGALMDVATERNGVFWIATTYGLARYTPPLWRTPAEILDIRKTFISIHEDREHRLWFTCEDRIVKYENSEWHVYPFPEGCTIRRNRESSLCSLPDGWLAVGITSGRILLFHPKHRKFRVVGHPDGVEIGFFSHRDDRSIWVSVYKSENSTYRMDIFEGQTFEEYTTAAISEEKVGPLRNILQISNTEILLGGPQGLGVYEGDKLRVLDTEQVDLRGVFCMLELEDGRYWFGGRDKIVEFNGKDLTVVRSEGLETVRSMIQSRDGTVWIGSGSGVHRYSNGSWITYTFEDGLPDRAVCKIYEDRHSRIWVATSEGLSLLHPEADSDPPQTYVSSQENPGGVLLGEAARLVVSAVDRWRHTAQDRLLYSYRFDEDPWSTFQEHNVVLRKGLTPGIHRFEVRAMDQNCNIDPTPGEFTFRVLLPWYREPMFLLFAAASITTILLLLGYALSRYVWLEKLVALRTEEIRATNRLLEDEIEERKRAEKALKTSEEEYQNLYDEAPIGYQEIDIEGRIVRVNRTEAELLGYAQEEMLGRFMSDFLKETDREEANRSIRRKISQEQRLEPFDQVFVAKDGKEIHMAVHDRLLIDNAGNVKGIRSVIRDVTEYKRLQEQLRQSQRLEAIGQLAGGVAHDFNNLLTIINSYSEMLQQSLGKDNPLQEDLKEIRDAGDRAASLTRQLLAFSRKQVLEPKILDLNIVVANLEKMLQRLIGENIEFADICQPDLGLIEADPGQIEQVIMNLAVNARDAMPTGGKLTIETANVNLGEEYANSHKGVTPGRYVMLAVTDTGVGMDEETRSKIFEPFFTTKERGKGTGLGLSTVYGIVKQTGGNIWVYSEPGRGTTFKVYLPFVEKEPQTAASERQPVALKGTETILVVEDEEAVRRLVCRTLERNGYTVLSASNGKDALAKFEHYDAPIHLTITDVIMPQMSGRELAERLSTIKPEIRILYVSGYTDNAIVHHGVLDSDVSFLQKPFEPETLLGKVRQILDL